MGKLVNSSIWRGLLVISAAMTGWGVGAQQAYAQAVFIVPEPAGAVPHLYNEVLRALNAASYVEPAIKNPLVPGISREDLLEKRTGYTASPAQSLTGTATSLNDVVTRSITLEGQDLRTQERADEYAREVLRQRQLASIIEKLCREAFGSEDCILKQGPPEAGKEQQLVKERERAFVTDPLAMAQIPIQNGALAALDSGLPEYDEKAKRVLQEAQDGGPVNPLAYSNEIAEVRAILSDNQFALDSFNRIVEKVKNDNYRPQHFDTEAIAAAVGRRAAPPSESAEEQLALHARSLSEGIGIYDKIHQIAEAAKERVTGEVFMTIVDQAIPDRSQITRSGYQGVGATNEYGEIAIVDTAPANVKVGLQRELLPLLAQIVADPDFVDPDQINNPGGVSASDAQGNLTIGAKLDSFEKADIIAKGLYHQSGVTQEPGLHLGNILQRHIAEILKNIRG